MQKNRLNLAIAAICCLSVAVSRNDAQAQNLLANGDFETPDASFFDEELTFDGWNAWFSPETLATQIVVAQSGIQSLKLFSGSLFGGAAAFQDFPASPGETYDANVWARLDSTDLIMEQSFGYAFLEFWDAGKANKLSEITSLNIAAPTAIEVVAGNPDYKTLPLDTWVEQELTLTAPAGTAVVSFGMAHIQLGDFENISAGTVFFDNASLTLNDDPGQPGDFDGDGDVDGADFLDWQRTDGTPTGLTAWQDNYGFGALAAVSAVSAVPEPSTFLMAALTVVGTCVRRRRSS